MSYLKSRAMYVVKVDSDRDLVFLSETNRGPVSRISRINPRISGLMRRMVGHRVLVSNMGQYLERVHG